MEEQRISERQRRVGQAFAADQGLRQPSKTVVQAKSLDGSKAVLAQQPSDLRSNGVQDPIRRLGKKSWLARLARAGLLPQLLDNRVSEGDNRRQDLAPLR